jgi:hypothetical protein
MEHSVEVTVYVLDHPTDIEYDEVSLEVVFNVENKDIYQYFLKDSSLNEEELNELRKDNPSLDRRIERAIDNYLLNHEEEFYDENR